MFVHDQKFTAQNKATIVIKDFAKQDTGSTFKIYTHIHNVSAETRKVTFFSYCRTLSDNRNRTRCNQKNFNTD